MAQENAAHGPKSNGDDESNPLLPREKHVFVLSHAGKPIFTRHGDEQRLAPLMGVIQAIISFSQSTPGETDDCIRSITAGKRKFVFLLRQELYLVAVTTTGEPEPFLHLQLEYLYHQIVFLLTAGRIQAKFSSSASYDLRDLLGATHNVLAGVVDMASPSTEMAGCMMTGSVPSLPLPSATRDDISRTIATCCRPATPNSLLYGLLLCGTRLVTLVQPRDARLHLHASDLLLIINFVSTQPGLRRVESWTPVCLPRFNDRGFLYAYIGFLSDHTATTATSSPAAAAPPSVSLLLISASEDPEQFRACCGFRADIERVLVEKGYLQAMAEAAGEHRKAMTRYSNGAMAFHFLYKYCPPSALAASSSSSSNPEAVVPQCTSPSFFFPYIDDEAKQRVWCKYVTAILQLRYGGRSRWEHMVDAVESGSKKANGGGEGKAGPARPSCVMDVMEVEAEHSLVYEVSETDVVVVNVGPDFELFALLSSAIDLAEVVHSCNRLIRSIKREEAWLFMTQAAYWT